MRVFRHAIGSEANLNYVDVFVGVAQREGSTVTELVNNTGSNLATVSRICQLLEEKHGLVVRKPHPVEFRAKTIYLTKEGKALVEAVATAMTLT